MTGMADEQDNVFECGKPCSPDNPCDECAAYWERMANEGLWDREQHRWTDKGWKSITRCF